MKTRRHLIIAGLVLIAVTTCLFTYLNIPTFHPEILTFSSSYKGNPVSLEASFWRVHDAPYGVIICPGYSCDRQKWRPVAGQLLTDGLSVMTFDYSGQGASSGSIGFDNAKTDSIPIQISAAIEAFHEASGLPYNRIILLGHSMGGRAILRLLYDYNNPEAETSIQRRDLAAAVLFSPEVNYQYNAQASLFAGTSDAEESPWNIYDEDCAGDLTVYLYGSTADDIVSEKDVLAMAGRLGNHAVTGITGGVLHSYEMYSPRFSAFLNEAIASITGSSPRFRPWTMYLVYAGWFSGLAGILLMLLGLNHGISWTSPDAVPVLRDSRRFLLAKLLFWIPGTVAAVIICGICAFMPFGSPIMNIPYMCFIAGYGIVMYLCYRKGGFRGTEGNIQRISALPSVKWRCSTRTAIITCAVTLALCFFVWFCLRATMYRLVPLNFRLFWLILSTIFMSVGYYVSGYEADMLDGSSASVKVRVLYSLIQYVPLFLLVGFYMVLKSYSGMIGQLQNMLLMYIFCIPLGNYVKKRSGSRLTGAVVTAFLFQTIMITSAALISF